MYRLLYCALAIHVTVSVATPALAEVGAQDTGLSATDLQDNNKTIGRGPSLRMATALGVGKAPLPCPAFCVPRRVTDPDFATVGERDVLAFAAANAITGPRLRVDSRRPVLAMLDKIPSAAALPQSAFAVTRTEFRPALDPVLAEPTITSPE